MHARTKREEIWYETLLKGEDEEEYLYCRIEANTLDLSFGFAEVLKLVTRRHNYVAVCHFLLSTVELNSLLWLLFFSLMLLLIQEKAHCLIFGVMTNVV